MKKYIVLLLILFNYFFASCQTRNIEQEKRFVFIIEKLDSELYAKLVTVENTLDEIEELVMKKGAPMQGREYVKIGHLVKSESIRPIEQVYSLRQSLIPEIKDLSNAPKKLLNLKNNYNTSEIANLMLSEGKSKLLPSLKEYSEYIRNDIRKKYNIRFKKYIPPDEDFFEEYFTNCTILEAIIILQNLELDILEKETEILNELLKKAEKL